MNLLVFMIGLRFESLEWIGLLNVRYGSSKGDTPKSALYLSIIRLWVPVKEGALLRHSVRVRTSGTFCA